MPGVLVWSQIGLEDDNIERLVGQSIAENINEVNSYDTASDVATAGDRRGGRAARADQNGIGASNINAKVDGIYTGTHMGGGDGGGRITQIGKAAINRSAFLNDRSELGDAFVRDPLRNVALGVDGPAEIEVLPAIAGIAQGELVGFVGDERVGEFQGIGTADFDAVENVINAKFVADGDGVVFAAGGGVVDDGAVEEGDTAGALLADLDAALEPVDDAGENVVGVALGVVGREDDHAGTNRKEGAQSRDEHHFGVLVHGLCFGPAG